MAKTFTFDQISAKIDDVYNYLDERQLKLSGEYDDLDDLNRLYAQVNDLYKKLGHLRSAFGNSVINVIDQKQSDIVKQVVLTCPDPAQLIAFTNRVRKLNQDLHHRVEDPTYLTLDEVNDSRESEANASDHQPDDSSDQNGVHPAGEFGEKIGEDQGSDDQTIGPK